ncbi:nucleoside 2-deoxyribosyltransferase [Methylocapsa polymorpha]|uniref:Nucleoside 2-deoxyribosyltransferase n=1 Tax=Methylocapsa polymorpha TaxID=3080828 RepID=A0ABZ0HUN2_9HYPH|nr:nucleoside 2-deoxyribosyltransferase [Methylocapsa sp. RX1]
MPNATEIGRRKRELCAEFGFDGLFPFDNEASGALSEARVDRLIYQMCLAMIREADGGIFNLTPFRGPSADVGTVFELGVLTGFGKPVFAYSNESDTLLDRLKRDGLASFDEAASQWRDLSGMTIENYGNADNLMLDACLTEQGHPLVTRQTAAAERFTDLQGFVACLERASRHFFPAKDIAYGDCSP